MPNYSLPGVISAGAALRRRQIREERVKVSNKYPDIMHIEFEFIADGSKKLLKVSPAKKFNSVPLDKTGVLTYREMKPNLTNFVEFKVEW